MPIISTSKVFFQGDAVASRNYLYQRDSVASTVESSIAGQVDVSGYDLKSFQIIVPTKETAASAITYKIEGRMNPLATFTIISTASILPAGLFVNVTHNVDYIRVGVKKEGTGTAKVSVVGYLGES